MPNGKPSAERDPIIVAGKRGGKTDQMLRRMREEGFNEGLEKGRQEILDWLENAYLNPSIRPARTTPEAEAIMTLARDAHAHFTAKMTARNKKGRK